MSSLRITALCQEPLSEIPYWSAGARDKLEHASLPVLQAGVDGLPAELDALICASDLQGVVPSPRGEVPPRLLGEVVAEELQIMAELGMLPPADRIGVLLAGDFYAAAGADERGASGDVRPVWAAFGTHFRWVAGVGGNHDCFGSAEQERLAFFREPRRRYLDGEVHTFDGLAIGGVSGIVGRPDKPMRHDEATYRRLLRRVLGGAPALVLLHESPAVPERGLIGSALTRQLLAQLERGLVICGHCHWEQPLAQLPAGCQVLNVDARVVLLLRERVEP